MGRLTTTLVSSALVLLFSNSTVHAKLPDNIYLDDGFAWFATETQYQYDGGKRSDGGWSLTCELRVHGALPPRSALKLVVKNDGDEVATIRNEMLVYNPDPARREGGSPVAHAYRCGQEDKQVIQGTGEFDIDVYIIDGNSLEENFAKTYTIDVRQVQRAGGGTLEGNIPEQDAPEYYVSRHGEILSSFMHLIPEGYTSFESKNPETNQNNNGIEIIYNVSGPSDQQPGSEAFFRCSVDGDPITLGKDGHRRPDQATSRAMRETVAIHSDRNALQYRNIAYQEEISFRQRVISVPLTFGAEKRRAFGLTVLEEHPGEWACSLVQNGKTIRTFLWEVSADGPIVPHPEHEEGLHLGPNTYFIETQIPEGGSYTDARIVTDAAEDTGFYGREWESRAAKRMADKLEDLGNPYPIASAPTIEGQDTAGATASGSVVGSAQVATDAEEQARAEQEAAEEAAAEAAKAAAAAAAEAQAQQQVAEREAEIERLRAAGDAAAAAEVEAELAEAREALANAQARAEEAAAGARGRGVLHLLVSLALSAALLAVGACLAADTLKARLPAAQGLIQALAPRAALLGILAMGLAVLDFVFDLIALRPLVGDGVPQLIALAGGFILWRSSSSAESEIPEAAAEAVAKANEALERHSEKIEQLNANSVGIGLACLVGGLIHLLLGGFPFV